MQKRVFSRVSRHENPPIAFMFPGQGRPACKHGAGTLRTRSRFFREQVNACCEILSPHLGFDLRAVLYYPTAGKAGAAQEQITQTAVAQTRAVYH